MRGSSGSSLGRVCLVIKEDSVRAPVIGQFIEMADQKYGIVGSTTCSNYYVKILNMINQELLEPSNSVALHRHSNALVDVLPLETDSSILLLNQSEMSDATYNDIGGWW